MKTIQTIRENPTLTVLIPILLVLCTTIGWTVTQQYALSKEKADKKQLVKIEEKLDQILDAVHEIDKKSETVATETRAIKDRLERIERKIDAGP